MMKQITNKSMHMSIQHVSHIVAQVPLHCIVKISIEQEMGLFEICKFFLSLEAVRVKTANFNVATCRIIEVHAAFIIAGVDHLIFAFI